MKRCPITYDIIKENQRYSLKGLKLLSKTLKKLHVFPFTAKEQLILAGQLVNKLSIQGIQPKLSALLNIKKEGFEIVEKGGKFILKPPHPLYDEVPQNEDLTMKMAAAIGIDVPLHGMIYNSDNSLTYFIKRFDREGRNKKIATEDFSLFLNHTRETKYDSSLEKVASVIENQCTFPMLEKVKLFRLVLFSFLVGNEDMHLKNFLLIRHAAKVELSPAYDLLNTTLIINAKEESALPLRGKKSKLNRSDLLDYFGRERLGLSTQVLDKELAAFEASMESWKALIAKSFLSPQMRAKYEELLTKRWLRFKK